MLNTGNDDCDPLPPNSAAVRDPARVHGASSDPVGSPPEPPLLWPISALRQWMCLQPVPVAPFCARTALYPNVRGLPAESTLPRQRLS
jgi:hypothetical protein